MSSRSLILLAISVSLAAAQSKKTFTDEEVMMVHRSALLIDTHNDVTSRTVEGWDIGSQFDKKGHTDIPRLRAGGVGAVFFAVYVGAGYTEGNRSAHRALDMIDTVRHDIVRRYPSQFQFATTAEEIERAHRAGRIAALMGIEGGHAIEDDLRLLRDFYALGIRYMTLTHTNTNGWADSSGDITNPAVKHHNGLSDLGKDVVREMNRLGMMVDISHVSDKTFQDVIETSRAPVFASHSSCRALSNVPRNMTDDMIRALAAKKGVVQINFACEFLSQKTADASAPLMQKAQALIAEGKLKRDEMFAWYEKESQNLPRATLADVVAHIDHVVKIAGIDSVGIGSDFDGIGCTPEGLDDVGKFPNLTRALLEKGYSTADIRKIYGGNTLRLMRAVEAIARDMQARE